MYSVQCTDVQCTSLRCTGSDCHPLAYCAKISPSYRASITNKSTYSDFLVRRCRQHIVKDYSECLIYTILDTRISVLRHAQGTPPWILKRGGLESSGRKLISSFGKTKRIAFFFFFRRKKNIFKIFRFFEKK